MRSTDKFNTKTYYDLTDGISVFYYNCCVTF